MRDHELDNDRSGNVAGVADGPPCAGMSGAEHSTADAGSDEHAAEPLWPHELAESGITPDAVAERLRQGRMPAVESLVRPLVGNAAAAREAALDLIAMTQAKRFGAEVVGGRGCEMGLPGPARVWRVSWYSGQPAQEGRPAVLLPRRTSQHFSLFGQWRHGFVTHHLLSEQAANRVRRRLRIAAVRVPLLAGAGFLAGSGAFAMIVSAVQEDAPRLWIAGGVMAFAIMLAALAWMARAALPAPLRRIGAAAFAPWWIEPHLEGRELAEHDAQRDERTRRLAELVQTGSFRRLRREAGSTREAVVLAAGINGVVWGEETLPARRAECALCPSQQVTHIAAGRWAGRLDGGRPSTDWPLLLLPPYWFVAAWRYLHGQFTGAGDPELVEFDTLHPLCGRCARAWAGRRIAVTLAFGIGALAIAATVMLMGYGFIRLADPFDGAGGNYFLAGLVLFVAMCFFISRLAALRNPPQVRPLGMRPFRQTNFHLRPIDAIPTTPGARTTAPIPGAHRR